MGWPPVAADALEVRFLNSLQDISPADWNALSGTDYPFLRHEFLSLLEQTGCCDAESGWQPCHATLYRGEQLIALMPLYLKSHSYGEYVFDWSWADAWHRSGLEYYPKLVTAAPFTPATGPRLCIAEAEDRHSVYAALLQAVRQFAEDNNLSSWHVLFPDAEASELLEQLGTSRRLASQFHWFNNSFSNFDDFLASFNSRKRKSLKRERRRVQEQGIELRRLQGQEISAADWERFYRFYQLTYAKRSGHGGYLNRDFFMGLGDAIGEQCILVMARRDGEDVAGALYFRSSDTVFQKCIFQLSKRRFINGSVEYPVQYRTTMYCGKHSDLGIELFRSCGMAPI